jgi:hypothetical protein
VDDGISIEVDAKTMMTTKSLENTTDTGALDAGEADRRKGNRSIEKAEVKKAVL